MKKLLFAFIFFIGLSFAILGFGSFLNKQKIAAISNFDECAAAGYPIMESYPARCMTPDKRSFTQELSEEEKKRLIPPTEQISCGNGVCEDITCDAIGCPEGETPTSCPQDCPYDR
ncbi:MAG TPA: hypothetical protein PLD54_01025 [Candidatus Levybacteria bacterium]|nr:hypothetical protein [Candidatus Levybacteria bacterium]